MRRSATRSARVVNKQAATEPGGMALLPNRSQLLIHAKRFDPATLRITDKVGASERDPLPLQYIQADGTGYFVNAEMVSAGRTITNITKNGTSTVTSPSAGRVNMTAGTCWDFSVTWSDGPVSSYQFASKTGASTAIAYDVSSNGRHLTATGFSNIDTVCASGYTAGSDHCTLIGYTSTAFGPVPAQTANPSSDVLGNATQYPGRAKYSIKPVQAVCATFASGTSLAITNTNGVAVEAGSSYVNAGTATVTVGTNSITYLAAGTVYNLRITSNGRTITIPFIEGSGTTAYGYDDQGGRYQCAITASDISAFWAGRQNAFFPGLQYGCSVGRWSPVDRQYKDEPTRTNKISCIKANPINTTNLTKIGDAGAVLSVVDDSYALNAAGLIHVCTSGQAYKLDNSSGSSAAYAQFNTTGNTNAHSASVYCRLTQGSGKIQMDSANFTPVPYISGSNYVRYVGVNFIPTGVNARLLIRAEAGSIVYFILPQLEEGSTVTSPIIGDDSASQQTANNATHIGNPYTGKDMLGNELTNKPGLINPSAQYKFSAAKQVIDAYPSAFTGSTPNNLTDTQLHTLGVGPRLFHGTTKHNTALYSADQDAASQLKIGKVIK